MLNNGSDFAPSYDFVGAVKEPPVEKPVEIAGGTRSKATKMNVFSNLHRFRSVDWTVEKPKEKSLKNPYFLHGIRVTAPCAQC
jgi:hypothetical protein